MSYSTFFLVFEDEQDMLAHVPSEWVVDGVVSDGFGRGVCVVGITYRDDTPEGEPPVAKKGYKLNVRLKDPLPDTLLPFVIPPPNHPEVVFA